MKDKITEHGNLSSPQQHRNNHIDNFRKQIEDWGNEFKEFKMFSHKYRGNQNIFDFRVRIGAGVLNAKKLQRHGLFNEIKWNLEDKEENIEYDPARKKRR